MYNALIQPDVPINKINNNKLSKFLYGLTYLDGTSVKVLFSPNIILQNGTGVVVKNMFFVIKINQ
jgi:hypothetical protein